MYLVHCRQLQELLRLVLVNLTILSTAEKSELDLVATGLTSWSLQWSSITSDAVVDLEVLFHRREHLANVDLDTRLYNGLTSAFEASTVDAKLRRWQAQRWCLGSWYFK